MDQGTAFPIFNAAWILKRFFHIRDETSFFGGAHYLDNQDIRSSR